MDLLRTVQDSIVQTIGGIPKSEKYSICGDYNLVRYTFLHGNDVILEENNINENLKYFKCAL